VHRALPLTILLALLTACYSGSRPPRIGTPAPDFTVQDSDHTVNLHDLHGQVIVLNFWATWCAPCVEEMPSLEQLQERFKGKGITVLAVSIDDDGNAYHQFLKDHKVDMLTVRDESKHSSILYGTFKYPETYVIDRNGIIRRKFIGAVEWSQPEVVEYLRRLE
jgi:cytochrome c biogenesis protein CcmG, thiol:disulfide interchange protein DsbE